MAQNVGDVGQDGSGNVYTFTLDQNGNGVWTRGRTAPGRERTILAERYTPTIWTDPDGCEHWVMDDGAEGFMTPHVTRDGRPVCNRGRACGVMSTDQFFATDSSNIHAQGRAALMNFFRSTTASAFGIYGHTDSRASDAYNLSLSKRRADAVAAVARASGARVIDVVGYGERIPRASNATASGKAQNRRVEVTCYR
ncbi:OmpA family protein [Jannaschia sp. M317]|nr:OmpA family protein [Jannaschia sp. M317]